MSHDFSNKVLAITGGAAGIGLSIAKLLHSRGAKISICDWSQENLDKAAEAIGISQENFLAHKCDVRDLSEVRNWIKQTIDRFGQLNGAANFAGILAPNVFENDVGEQDEDDWDSIIGINLTVRTIPHTAFQSLNVRLYRA